MPRLGSKSCVTTPVAHPTQTQNLVMGKGPSPSRVGLNRKTHFLSAVPGPPSPGTPTGAAGIGRLKGGTGLGHLSALPSLSKHH